MSKTVIAEIRNNVFPRLTIEPGTFVVWRNLDPYAHSVETKGDDLNYFNAGAMHPNEASSPIFFAKPGSFSYLCRFHTEMTGTVVVAPEAGNSDRDHDHGHGGGTGHGPDAIGGHDHGHDHGLAHYHGFVTGGWSGDRIYMTHTPVLADERHNYQVILRGHFVKPRHARIYEGLRESAYGDQVVQIFHDHMSMPDIGAGNIKLLPNAEVAYWPGGTQTTIGPAQITVPGLEDVPIAIDEVLHFHQFKTDEAYPDALTYIMYGDDEDVFIDHLIEGAPSFHSVAKLAKAPKGWTSSGARLFKVPGRAIRSLQPRQISRVAMVDNAFHLFWLLPPGALVRQAQDPLIVRGNAQPNHNHSIEFEGGEMDDIEIARFLHFDIRLLNYGVLIT
jgi:hypothetical protein